MKINKLYLLAIVLVFSCISVNLQAQGLWGSSSSGTPPESIFTIDETTGMATLVGSVALGSKVSAIAFQPATGELYGISGNATGGADLILINRTDGSATVIGTLVGSGFDATMENSGSDALAFAADGTLYAGGWLGGFVGGSLLTVDPATGAVLSATR